MTLAKANYRKADDPKTSCATCSYLAAGNDCTMFKVEVNPVYVCDEWEAK